ncbi:MAG: hypothetical protein JNL54_19520 [Kineosporiaceae bacterium]|nr:hypothetical protein [Kineosporiaceae bacterium]
MSRPAALIDRVVLAAGVSAVGIAALASAAVPLGLWRPVVAVPGAVVISVGAWWLLTLLGQGAPPDEARPGEPGPSGRPATLATPSTLSTPSTRATWATWGLPAPVLTAIIAVAFTIWNAVLHSQHLVLRRDPGAYALYTQWIATEHGLPIPARLAEFGGPAAYQVPGFTLGAPAYYEVLSGAGESLQAQIVPQFLVGAPALFSYGWWAGELVDRPWTGMAVVPAVLGGLALLAFGSLTSRLIGPRWAPLAVLALGLCYPVAWVARSTFSEPAALLALLVGACLAVDALTSRQATAGWVAGGVLGLAALVRVDAVREVAVTVAACALLTLRGNRAAAPIAGGAVAGTTVSVGVWVTMSRPYLETVSSSVIPLLVATAGVIVATGLAVVLARVRATRSPIAAGIPASVDDAPRAATAGAHSPGGRSPRVAVLAALLAATGVAAVGLVLASRPLWLVVRQDPNSPSARFVASLQRGQGLPVDGGRMYAEHSLEWVAWYLGWPAVVAAWAVLAVLAARTVGWWAGRSPASPPWLLPATAGFASSVLVLYRPGITPDHPWADRRLVTVVFPLMVLAAVVGIRWAAGWLGSRWPSLPQVGLVLAGAGLLLVPTLWATWPVALLRTERGELAAVEGVCRQLQPGDAVVAVEATDDGRAQRSANEWPQVIRGVCGRPSAALLTPAADLPDAVRRLRALVEAAGGRLVLLTAQEDAAEANRVLDVATGGPAGQGAYSSRTSLGSLVTVEDRKLLTRRPPGGARLVIEVWLAR